MGVRKQNNYAFIDEQNIYMGTQRLGWAIDYVRFRRYLGEKYSVAKALIFLGYLESNKSFYQKLTDAGYVCIFKPVAYRYGGSIKGNCDAELVLHVMIELQNCDRVLIVSGDGDFFCLISYLLAQNKLLALIAPSQASCAALYKKGETHPFVRYMSSLESRVGSYAPKTKKTP